MISKRSVGALLGLIVLLAVGTLIQDFRFDSLLSRERANAAASSARSRVGLQMPRTSAPRTASHERM